MRTAVIIPSAGHVGMVDRCLESVWRGSRQPDEVFLIFQGIPDPALHQEITHRHPRVRVIWSDRPGASAARNAGACAANADLLLFVDDDCEVESRWVEAYVETFASDDIPGVAGGRVLPGAKLSAEATNLGFQRDEVARVFTHLRNPVGALDRGGNLAVRRRVFLELRGFDESLGPGTSFKAAEDTDLVYRAMKASVRMAYVPGAVVYHALWRAPGEVNSVERGYGIGLGAFVAGHVREGDLFAITLLPRLLWFMGVRPVLIGIVRGRSGRARSGFRYLSSIPLGFCKSLVRRRTRLLDVTPSTSHAESSPPC